MATPIRTPGRLIEAASREGFKMGEEEAKVILGYMEGHDYELGVGGNGEVVRNDLAYERHEEHWEPYSIRDAILFAGDMCAELIELEELNGEEDGIKLADLRKDDSVLSDLYVAAMLKGGQK